MLFIRQTQLMTSEMHLNTTYILAINVSTCTVPDLLYCQDVF